MDEDEARLWVGCILDELGSVDAGEEIEYVFDCLGMGEAEGDSAPVLAADEACRLVCESGCFAMMDDEMGDASHLAPGCMCVRRAHEIEKKTCA